MASTQWEKYPGLNEHQERAIYTDSKQVVVRASPGTGKTRIISFRILHLLQNLRVAPSRIYAVTFSHKAAREMTERVEDLIRRYLGEHHPLLKAKRGRAVQISTFHSLGLRILRESGNRCQILSEHQKRVRIECGTFDSSLDLMLFRKLLDLDEDGQSEENPAEVMAHISNLKNRGILCTNQKQIKDSHLARIYREYEKHKDDEGLVDFDDLILRPYCLLQEDTALRDRISSKVQYLLVDEYQDTNSVQYFLSRQLCHIHERIFVVGDPDQCIFAFRDANRHNIELVKRDFPNAEKISLTENYRSTQIILDCAIKLMENTKPKETRVLNSNSGQGDAIIVRECFDEAMEGEYIANEILSAGRDGRSLDAIAVLCRTNFQLKPFEEVFSKHNIQYRVRNTVGFYQQQESQELADMLRFIANPRDLDLFQRLMRLTFHSVFSETIEDIVIKCRDWIGSFTEQQNPDPILFCNVITFLRDHVFAKSADISTEIDTMDSEDRAALEQFTSVFYNALQMHQRNEHVESVLAQLVDGLGFRTTIEMRPNAQKRLEVLGGMMSLAREIDQGENKEKSYLNEFLAELGAIDDAGSVDNTADSEAPAVTMTTLHGSKGLEWPVVFIPGVEERRLPFHKAREPEEIEEERRLFYVGITRAKHKLVITKLLFRKHGDEFVPTRESRFLKLLRKKLQSTHLLHSKLELSKEQKRQLQDLEEGSNRQVQQTQDALTALSEKLSLEFASTYQQGEEEGEEEEEETADVCDIEGGDTALSNGFITVTSMMSTSSAVFDLPDTQFIDQLNELEDNSQMERQSCRKRNNDDNNMEQNMDPHKKHRVL